MSTYTKKIQLIRNHYNHKINTHPHNTAIHTEYALFEELLNEYNRSRTIYENAVAHNHSNTNLWKNYACFELRQCDINRCRSILERAIQTNPKEICLWLFFAELEEDMMNIAGVIDVYGRMVAENNTEDCYWHAYNFYLVVDDGLANEVLKTMDEKFAGMRIKVEKLVRMNDFSVVPFLCDRWESMDDKTCVKIVDKLEKAGRLQDAFIFVKRGKYRFGSKFFKDKYRKMSTGVVDEDDDEHCSALLCEAARLEKQKDICAAEQIYKGLLNVINRKYRTKSFILYSKFLVRREKLPLARKNYGRAIAQHLNVYEEYLSMERVLDEKQRIRRIYEKYLEDRCMDARVWLQFIEFEESLDEVERAKYLFKNALMILKNGVEIIEEEYKKRKYKK